MIHISMKPFLNQSDFATHFRIAHRELETGREGHWAEPTFATRTRAEEVATQLNFALLGRLHFWVEEIRTVATASPAFEGAIELRDPRCIP
jgi:hypothetical protein